MHHPDPPSFSPLHASDMPCTSPSCTMCDHPAPSSPALITLETTLLSLTLTALRAFPPFPPKASEAKQLKAALKATSSLSSAATKRHLLPFTASSALAFLRAFETLILPLLEARHAAILVEAERWEEMMPSLVGRPTPPGEMGYEEVWAVKRERWRKELERMGVVGEKWELLAVSLKEVARRGMKEEDAALPLDAAGAIGSVAGAGGEHGGSAV
ncbi:hypothetical protein JCM6882_002252 [Rhodosporidiobolus microsporus]